MDKEIVRALREEIEVLSKMTEPLYGESIQTRIQKLKKKIKELECQHTFSKLDGKCYYCDRIGNY